MWTAILTAFITHERLSVLQSSVWRTCELKVNSPTLALFDPEVPTIFSTDASDYGVGASFTQMYPDHIKHTVAFASRTLISTEGKYSTVEKEALACM